MYYQHTLAFGYINLNIEGFLSKAAKFQPHEIEIQAGKLSKTVYLNCQILFILKKNYSNLICLYFNKTLLSKENV